MDKPKLTGRNAKPGWLKLEGAFGETPDDRTETRRIQAAIDAEFERIDPEDYADDPQPSSVFRPCDRH